LAMYLFNLILSGSVSGTLFLMGRWDGFFSFILPVQKVG